MRKIQINLKWLNSYDQIKQVQHQLSSPNKSAINITQKNQEQTLSAMKTFIENSILKNHEEYQEFCNLCNKTDNKSKSEKIKMEEWRGFKNQDLKPEKVLKSMILTHVKLINTYNEVMHLQHKLGITTKPSLTPEVIKSIEHSFENPKVKIEDKQFHKYLMGEKRLESHSADVHVKTSFDYMGAGVSTNIHYHSRYNDPNPDNDGKYATVTLKLNMEGVLSSDNFLIRNLQDEIKEKIQLSDSTGLDISEFIPNITLGMRQKKEHLIQLKYRLTKKGFHLQYQRDLSGSSKEVALTKPLSAIIPITAGIRQKTTEINYTNEKLGINTLSYIQKRYIGWRAGGKESSWEDFVNNNKTSITDIICKMTHETTNIHQELIQLMDHITPKTEKNTDYYNKKLNKLLQVFKDLREDKNNEEKFKTATEALKTVFSEYFPIYQKKGGSRFSDRPLKLKK